MKTKLLTSTILSLISGFAFAQNVNVHNEGTLNIAPTFCEISSISKVPSCTISIQASQGSRVTTAFYLRQQASIYEDSLNILDPAFSGNTKGFTTNPLFADYEKDGTKQIRLIYSGKLTSPMTTGELYGRMIINIEKPGSSPFLFNLPVYFSTDKNQKAAITSATVSTTTHFDGRNFPRPVTTLTVTNDGSGVFAINGISFNKKINPADYTYNDFAQVDANVLPHSRDTILIRDERLARQLQEAKGSTIILSSKRKTEYVEVAIER
jgi:hypothetical protein